MADSVGGLYLQVKLQTDEAQRKLETLGKEFNKALDPKAFKAAMQEAFGAVTKAQKDSIGAMKSISGEQAAALKGLTAQTKATANASIAQSRVQVAQAKVSSDAIRKETAVRTAEIGVIREQTKASGDLAKIQEKGNQNVRYLEEQARLRKEAAAATKKQKDEQKKLNEENEEQVSTLKEVAKLGTVGAQELFVGLGAARSGNLFYGLAAMARYGKNVMAQLKKIPPQALAIAAAFLVTVGAAAALYAAVLGIANQLVRMGSEGAIKLQFLQAQLRGLIGNAAEAKEEFDFLLDLGKRSIVPTEQLIEADRAFVAFGISNSRVRKALVESLSILGSAAGLTTAQVGNLQYALAQINSTGRVTAQDFRQLGNAGVATNQILESMAASTGKSVGTIREELSAGTGDIAAFYSAFIGYSAELADAAEATAQTVTGAMQNLKEEAQTGLAEAFLTAGVPDAIGGILTSLRDQFGSFKSLFEPLADAARDAFFSIQTGIERMFPDSVKNDMATFFKVTLPAAVRTVGNVISWIIQLLPLVLRPLLMMGNVMSTVFRNGAQSGGMLQGVIRALAGGFAAVIGVVSFLIGVMFALYYAVKTVFLAVKGLILLILLQGGGAMSAFRESAIAGTNAFLAMGVAVKATASAIGDIASADLTRPAAGPLTDKGPADREGAGGGGALEEELKEDAAAAKKAKSAADAAAKTIAQARNVLYEMLREWFGQPSELRASMFGTDGFDAQVSSIVSTAKKITQALEDIPGTSGLIQWLDRQTRQLIELAEKRDKLAERLKEAQKKLDDALKTRADFAKDLRNATIAFVNALGTENETIRSVTRLDPIGSFLVIEEERKKSFVQSMKDRLKIIRKFQKEIRKLQKRGLDPALVEAFLRAGPEGAGDAVSELANANDETLKEVNDLQADLEDLAGDFADEQADIYHGAAVRSAQALVDGLTRRISDIEDRADQIVTAIENRLKPLAAKMRETGTTAGEELGSGLSGGAEDAIGSWDIGDVDTHGLGETLGTGLGEGMLDGLDGYDFTESGENIVDGFFGGVGDSLSGAWESVKEWFNKWFIQPFKDLFGIESPSTVFWDFGEDIVSGLIKGIGEYIGGAWDTMLEGLNELLDNVTDWVKKLPANISGAIGTAWGWVWNLVPSWSNISHKFSDIRNSIVNWAKNLPASAKKSIGTAWGWVWNIVPSWGNISYKFSSLRNSIVNWAKNLPGSIKRSIGSLWGWVTNSFPSFYTIRKRMSNLYTAFKSIINTMIGYWNRLDPSISVRIPSWVPYYGGRTWRTGDIVPDLRYLASGGITTGPTMAMIGEAGQEAVIPLDRMPGLLSEALAQTGLSQTQVAPEIRVFVGNEEITQIVRTEVVGYAEADYERALAGRRT